MMGERWEGEELEVKREDLADEVGEREKESYASK